jgi:hypothetical protein
MLSGPCVDALSVLPIPKEISMRILALAILAVSAVAASAPARAQTYDLNHPVCLQIYGPISYTECNFSSLAQCNASASGRPAQCVVNPFFANAQAPLGRSYRHRRAY